MRYQRDHKAKIHRQIVKDASHRVRAEGVTGAAVTAVMRDAGLTHGGFYKHFGSKDELLIESLIVAFQETANSLADVGHKSPPETAWKAIINAYLSTKHCDHVEQGCPLAALASELRRTDKKMKNKIVAELTRYQNKLLPLMPGRRTADKESAFFVIFSTMIGAIEIARMFPDADQRETVLASARDFLLHNF
jgi:TetR/AcrR family transcriptional repressor of nem operon